MQSCALWRKSHRSLLARTAMGNEISLTSGLKPEQFYFTASRESSILVRYENSSCRNHRGNRDVCLDIDRAHGAAVGRSWINEIPNESAVLSAVQSSMDKKTRLYIFPRLGGGKNASREEKNEAMKQMQQRIAANPSGILMYHPPGRQFAFGKSLAVEFSTEVLQAILVIWLLAQTRIGSFAGRVGFVLIAGILAS